ncbi:hypothetical protein RclHR1_11110001 [Rhizophagus clarus]|uniref:Uncharacterized protein n=1 Tax=Rhizophagus clarus TaxID=94130 RepID=A0A2Z6Q819_9GLOM|nr:hypothetical protein RclHR1_11110001 [Rhizophagus clarus]
MGNSQSSFVGLNTLNVRRDDGFLRVALTTNSSGFYLQHQQWMSYYVLIDNDGFVKEIEITKKPVRTTIFQVNLI